MHWRYARAHKLVTNVYVHMHKFLNIHLNVHAQTYIQTYTHARSHTHIICTHIRARDNQALVRELSNRIVLPPFGSSQHALAVGELQHALAALESGLIDAQPTSADRSGHEDSGPLQEASRMLGHTRGALERRQADARLLVGRAQHAISAAQESGQGESNMLVLRREIAVLHAVAEEVAMLEDLTGSQSAVLHTQNQLEQVEQALTSEGELGSAHALGAAN
jgi:hypothetical protein